MTRLQEIKKMDRQDKVFWILDNVDCNEEIFYLCEEPLILIGDVLLYLNVQVSNNSELDDYTRQIKPLEDGLLSVWTKYAEPLDCQTDECLDFIIGVIDERGYPKHKIR